jgi:hypothetical protein
MNKIIFLLLISWILAGCSYNQPLITNSDRLKDIENMLKVQKALTSHALKPIWTLFDKPATPTEELAMKFMYAYMPLSDFADYSPEFIQANVRMSLIARQEMSWGKRIPEEEFLHFVLPMRVNNENLDSFRIVYYAELKQMVNGLSMKDAALEINHWCHEKVNYRGTDSRTSAPLSTIKKTFGRCGEESTFTVAAMRAAGIPARQVYTPRWAHTDDNHAWVEVWIDGKWHYMGACEPDTDLDRGWFSEPSQRTMLVHTRTYGRYFGPEEVLDAEQRFSELNLTSSYANTKKITILVNNSDGTAAERAKVEFKLYNYAEFYPLATLQTDKNGAAQFTTGLGSLLIWASKEGKFACQNLDVRKLDTLRLTLGKSPSETGSLNLDLVPPKATKAVVAASEKDQKINDKRLANEDYIRNSYMSTFRDTAWIRTYAKSHGLPEDSLIHVIRLSYGNWREIISFIEKNQTARHLLFPILDEVSDKDLSDTRSGVLTDHLTAAVATVKLAGKQASLNQKYILAPRIDLELLSPWRSFLLKNLGNEMAISAKKDISVLTNWVKTNIQIDPVANKHSRAALTPIGVYNLRVSDPLSRDIFFVAACRTFGIPARLNPESRFPEYYQSGNWFRAGFEAAVTQPTLGKLTLQDKNSMPPQYTLNFTLAKIQNGISRTLEFEEGKKLTDFPDPLLLETGSYLLTTGKRLSDGSVLSSLTFFEINKDRPVSLDVSLRKETNSLKSLGILDPSKINLTEPSVNKEIKLAGLLENVDAVIVLLDPDSEPSKHILNDLAPYLPQFNAWKGKFIFVTTAGKEAKSTAFRNYKLPSNSKLTDDSKNELGKALASLPDKDLGNTLPLVIFCQPTGDAYLVCSGYKIGIGEELNQLIKKVETSGDTAFKASCTSP